MIYLKTDEGWMYLAVVMEFTFTSDCWVAHRQTHFHGFDIQGIN